MSFVSATCQHCNSEFSYVRKARGRNRMYCSSRCGVGAYQLRQAQGVNPNICAQCDQPMAGRVRKYCDKQCYRAAFYARRNAAYVPHPLPERGVRVHTDKMICLAQGGATLEEIGRLYGVTRERIRQILKQNGITSAEGGAHARKEIRLQQSEIDQQKKEAARNRRYIRKHGMGFDDFKSLNDPDKWGGYTKTPSFAFRDQKRNAKQRGVEFNFIFAEWWGIWESSGKFHLRGQGGDHYCMARFNDEGPYAAGNIYIDTIRNNSTFGRTLAHERQKPRTPLYAVFQAAGGRKAVSDATGAATNYVSQLALNGSVPASWLKNGRIQAIADLTGGAYTAEQIIDLVKAA